jgi:hypothetical protein
MRLFRAIPLRPAALDVEGVALRENQARDFLPANVANQQRRSRAWCRFDSHRQGQLSQVS